MKKWLNKNIIGFSLASFFNDFCHEMTTALLPSYLNQIMSSNKVPLSLGLIQGTADALSTIMKLVSGWLADRIDNYKPFLIAGYGITSIVAFIGTTTSVLKIGVYKAIAWMFRGLRGPIRDTWLSKSVSAEFYGRAFGFQRMFDTLGATLGPLTAFFLLYFTIPIKTIFLFSFIPGIMSIFPILMLQQTKKGNTINSNTPLSLKISLQQLPPDFIFFLWSMFVFNCANFNQTLLLFRAQETLSGTHGSSILATSFTVLFYTFFSLIRGLTEFSMGFLGDYIDKKNLLAIFGFGFFAMSCIFSIFAVKNNFFWLLNFTFFGMSIGTVKVLAKAYNSELLPESIRGTGFGILESVIGFCNLFSNFIVGSLWTFFSPQVSFLYALILSSCAMLMLLLKK